jgi:hypothetical protein
LMPASWTVSAMTPRLTPKSSRLIHVRLEIHRRVDPAVVHPADLRSAVVMSIAAAGSARRPNAPVRSCSGLLISRTKPRAVPTPQTRNMIDKTPGSEWIELFSTSFCLSESCRLEKEIAALGKVLGFGRGGPVQADGALAITVELQKVSPNRIEAVTLRETRVC